MNPVIEILKFRASVRWFKPDPVPREILEQLIEVAIRAPTAGGGEQWFFIVVTDDNLRRKIHELLKKAHRIYAEKVLREPLPSEKLSKWMKLIDEGEYFAPAYIAAYIDLRNRLYKDEYYEFERIMAIQNLSAAIENILVAAHSLGLGAVWLGVPLLIKDEFDELLKPPKGCELQAIIAVGYPSREVKPRKRFKELNEVTRFL